jgi:hypothetical protein
VFGLVAGDQSSRGRYDAPPRQLLPVREHVAHGPRRSWIAGLLGDLSVRCHLSGSQRLYDPAHSIIEVAASVRGAPFHHEPDRSYPSPLSTRAIRALTSFRTSVAGGGLSSGNLIVPLAVSYFARSDSSSGGRYPIE